MSLQKLSLSLSLSLGLLVALTGCEGVVVDDDGGGEGEGEGEGEEGEGEGEGGVDPAEEALVNELVDALQEAIATCPDFAGSLGELEPAFLERAFDSDEAADSLRRDFADDAKALNEAAFDACVASLEDCTLDFQTGGECNLLFVGTRQLGDGCTEAQCAPGLSCFQAVDTCGTCQATPDEGESCEGDPAGAGNDAICTGGSTCIDDGAARTCEANLAEDAACDVDVGPPCGEGLTCVEAVGDVDTTCQPAEGVPAVVGRPCTQSFECGGFASGFACVNDACAAQEAAAPAAPCDVDGVRYCVNQFAQLNACVDDDADGVGICSALPGATAPCFEGRCSFGNACNATNVCEALPGAGQACSADGTCAQGFTCNGVTQQCVAPPVEGGDCSEVDCTGSLSCVDDVCVNDALICPA